LQAAVQVARLVAQMDQAAAVPEEFLLALSHQELLHIR
jgi:hypothetical protein